MDEIVRQMARVTEGPLYITFKLKQHTEDDYFVRKGEDRKRHLVKKEEAEEILEKHGYEVVDTDAERINERTTLGIEAEKT